MKGSCCVGVSGMEIMGSSSAGGVSGMNAEFKRLNLGIEPNSNHPLLKRVGWRVLVIDDPDPKSRFNKFNHVHLLFFYSGCQVHACTEPSMALSFLKERNNSVDFVICNIHMKGMDEATLCELVGLKDVLVIMMSSYMDTRLVRLGMNHGASSFILKPQSCADVQDISSFVLKRKKYPAKLPRNLYQMFDEVVRRLGGLDEAVPEKILELMNAENIIPLEVIDDHLKGCRVLAKLIIGTKKERQDAEAARYNVPSSARFRASYRSATDVLSRAVHGSSRSLNPAHPARKISGYGQGILRKIQRPSPLTHPARKISGYGQGILRKIQRPSPLTHPEPTNPLVRWPKIEREPGPCSAQACI